VDIFIQKTYCHVTKSYNKQIFQKTFQEKTFKIGQLLSKDELKEGTSLITIDISSEHIETDFYMGTEVI